MKVYGVDHVQLAIPANGESQARQFYGELLGLPEIAKPPNLASRGGAWFQCGALQLHLGVDIDFRPAKKAHPAFLVRDLPHLIEALRSAGYDVTFDVERVAGFERAFTVDPFGNRIELLQPTAAGSVR